MPSEHNDSDSPNDENNTIPLGSDEARRHLKKTQQIGPYTLIREIGAGGMGIVWEAEQITPVRRRVAIKVIRTGFGSADVLARFEAERQALAMMNHPNIAQIIDAGTTEQGLPYFAMEFMEGESLTQYCDNKRLSIEQRLRLFMQVCAGVHHAHRKGVIHRDLKPGNILVTEIDNRAVPKVIDFGLAKATQAEQRLSDATLFTEFGQVLGTLKYMSPEQANPGESSIDTRTDIYALGVVLYELLTGSTPLNDESIRDRTVLQLMEFIRRNDPVKPSSRLSSVTELEQSNISANRQVDIHRLNRMLQGDLDWIVLKSLEKEQSRRYATADQFAEDVGRYLDGQMVQARPPSLGYRIKKFVSRNRGFVASISAIILLLIVAVLGTSFGFLRADQNSQDAKQNQSKAEKESIDATEQRELEKKESDSEAKAMFQSAIAQWKANLPKRAMEYLYDIAWEYRDCFEWHLARRVFIGSDITLYDHGGPLLSVAYSPDGIQIVSTDFDRKINFWSAINGEKLFSIDEYNHTPMCLCYNTDGSILAGGCRDGTVILWDARTHKQLRLWNAHQSEITDIQFNHDGSQVATCCHGNGLVKIWDPENAEKPSILDVGEASVFCLDFSPGGSTIVFGTLDSENNGRIHVWDVATGTEKLNWQGHDIQVVSVQFSPDGSKIATACPDGSCIVWNATDGSKVSQFVGESLGFCEVVFSPDGERIASGTFEGLIKVWDINNGKPLMTLVGHYETVSDLDWSPDSARIVSSSADQTVKIWDARLGKPQQDMHSRASDSNNFIYSPDGAYFASSTLDGKTRIRNALTGEDQFTVEGHCVNYSPDGQKIIVGTGDGKLQVYQANNGDEILSWQGSSSLIASVSFDRKGQRVASKSMNGEIAVWDANTGAQIFCWDRKEETRLSRIAFDSNGALLLAVCDSNRVIDVFDVESRQQLCQVNHVEYTYVLDIAFNHDGSRLAACGEKGVIKIWNAIDGNEQLELKGHPTKVERIAFDSQGKRFASVGPINESIGAVSRNGVMKIWDAELGTELIEVQNISSPRFGIVFHPNGSQIVTGGWGDSIEIWDGRKGQERFVLENHNELVQGIAYSPQARKFATGNNSGEIMIWNADTGRKIAQWDAHGDLLHSLAFNSDGSRLVSTAYDRNVAIWNVETGKQLIDFQHSLIYAARVMFSADDKRILCGEKDQLSAWSVDLGLLIDQVDQPDADLFANCWRRRWKSIKLESETWLVDLEFKHTAEEKAYREAKARFDANWHQSKAMEYEEAGNWYAATFHGAWALTSEPNWYGLGDFRQAYQRLSEQYKLEKRDLNAVLSPVVKQMLKRAGID